MRKFWIVGSVLLAVVAAVGIWLWIDTEPTQIQTPEEENTPEKLIERLANAYDQRDWDVYDTVYTARVQRFFDITCGTYEECFTPHRESVAEPITHEITNQSEDGDALIIDVQYTHPEGEWCQTYTVVDTEFGYRVDFSTTPEDC